MFHSNETSSLQQSPTSRRQARSSQRNGFVPRSQQGSSHGPQEKLYLSGYEPLVPTAEDRARQSTTRHLASAAEDYPYELQLKLFGNHLLSLAEEAGRFDFRGTYTATEVAEILQVTPAKTYELLHSGEMPSIKIGRQFRIPKFAFWAYINGLDAEGLVEDILNRFVTQHCCRDRECVAVGGR